MGRTSNIRRVSRPERPGRRLENVLSGTMRRKWHIVLIRAQLITGRTVSDLRLPATPRIPFRNRVALCKGRNYCRPPWPYKNHGPGPVGRSSCGKSRMRAGGLHPRSPPSTRLVNNTAAAQLETPKAPWRTVRDPTRLTCLSDCPEALIGEVSCIFLVLLAASSSARGTESTLYHAISERTPIPPFFFDLSRATQEDKVVGSPSFWYGARHRFVKFPILFHSVALCYLTCMCPKLMNPLPLREPRKAQRNRDRGPWSPFTLRPRQRCPSPRRTYHQGTIAKNQPPPSSRGTNTPSMWGPSGRGTYLSDILVAHPADLLDVCGRLGDGLKGVAGQDQLILLGLGDLDIDTGLHDDSADELLADEVPVQVGISASMFPCLHHAGCDGIS